MKRITIILILLLFAVSQGAFAQRTISAIISQMIQLPSFITLSKVKGTGIASQGLDNFNLPSTRTLGFNVRVNF